MNDKLTPRTVFIVSDSTGITAETFSHSVMAQFDEIDFQAIRMPFIDNLDKADEVVRRIDRTALETGLKPIVFSTLVDADIQSRVRQANGLFLDLFGTFVGQIEQSLGLKSSHAIGRSLMPVDSLKYQARIDAINFSLSHDDGQFINQLDKADVILVGVSRCGKTPTSLYLAMQYAVMAANFPLTPDDFERGTLPKTVAPYRDKLFGLSIDPDRLSQVRNERRPNSQYATLEQCRYEVAEAERMMRRESIAWMSTTTKSIEEIATTVMQEVKLGR
ncbi:MAG TPA: pyruvate, water dikinase regulatory protein [Bordetella sp.]